MSSTIGIQNLIQALGDGRATFVAHVGPGATTTTIPLADLNLGAANLAGNLVLLDAGALGTGSAPTVTTISSNTATSLTVPALSGAPAQGATLWIFAVATIQANVSENVAQVGGQTVPTDDSGNTRAPVTEFRLEVFAATVPAGAVRHVGSGDDVAYQDLTINGTYRVDGVLRCGNLTVGAGGVLITGPGGEVETAAFAA